MIMLVRLQQCRNNATNKKVKESKVTLINEVERKLLKCVYVVMIKYACYII